MQYEVMEAVAYIRVSTTKQGEHGVGLEAQAAGIEAFAEAAGIRVIATYQDIASGVGSESLYKRQGMQSALRHAESLNIPILVYRMDRFSRDAQTVAEIQCTGHKIITVADGALFQSRGIGAAVRAEIEAKRISTSTKQALQKLKADGVKLGNPTNLDVAQKMGAEANHRRAEAKVAEIAEVLRADTELATLPVPKVVERLNEQGIMSGFGKPWTTAGLRRPLKAAKALNEKVLQDAYKDNPLFGRF